jgi:hypothetical protein
MTASEILFRCSSLGKIMAEGRSALTDNQRVKLTELEMKMGRTAKQETEMQRLIYKRDHPELPVGVRKHLWDIYISKRYGRREDIENKFLDKGHEREEDSITLYSRVTKTFFSKNDQRLSNDYITGEPDLWIGRDNDKNMWNILRALKITDTKTSWSMNTWGRAQQEPLDDDWEWQMHGYMWLTGAEEADVALCLVNGTAMAIMNEKRIASYRYPGIDVDQDPGYKKKCRQIELNHIFDIDAFVKENPFYQLDYFSTVEGRERLSAVEAWKADGRDIPFRERCYIFNVKRDEGKIEKIKKRISECREFMNKNFFKLSACHYVPTHNFQECKSVYKH